MPSILVTYDGDKIETRRFPGRLRGLSWNSTGSSLLLVGNAGKALSVQDDDSTTNLETKTRHNLRSVSVNPMDNTALIVGNSGTIIRIKENDTPTKLNSPTSENLRAARWNANGSMALIAGNNGALLKLKGNELEIMDDGQANLRGISWHNDANQALITSNCFAEEFIPSPNLFAFDAKEGTLKPISAGRADFIGVDWNPSGEYAVVVGYDVIWHTGFIGRFDKLGLSSVDFQNLHIYPTAVGWDKTGKVAAIATSTPQPQSGEGRIILWDGHEVREIYRNEEFFFSSIRWSPSRFKLAAIASTDSRTFNS